MRIVQLKKIRQGKDLYKKRMEDRLQHNNINSLVGSSSRTFSVCKQIKQPVCMRPTVVTDLIRFSHILLKKYTSCSDECLASFYKGP